MDFKFLISWIFTAILVILVIVLYSTGLPKNAEQNRKLLVVVAGCAAVGSVVAYTLFLTYFRTNPAAQLGFMACMAVLLLAGSFTSTILSSVHVAALRTQTAEGKEETVQDTAFMGVSIGVLLAVAFGIFGVLLYLGKNPSAKFHTTTTLIFLSVVPASILSATLSSVHLTGLRDSLAAKAQG
jgi:high-affinity Fe2+/Pb2+ permease